MDYGSFIFCQWPVDSVSSTHDNKTTKTKAQIQRAPSEIIIILSVLDEKKIV